MEQTHASGHPHIATAAGVAGHALVGLIAIALLAGFALALRSSDAWYKDTAATVGRRTPAPVVAQPAAVARDDPPVVYVYGPPELTTALPTDLTAAMSLPWIVLDSTGVGLITDGLEGGQHKVFFIDLR